MTVDLVYGIATREEFQGTPADLSLRGRKGCEIRKAEFNRLGLSMVYNGWLDTYAGQDVMLVLMHDDVFLADGFVESKLAAMRRAVAIQGLAGTSRLSLLYSPLMWFQPEEGGQAHMSGAVQHGDGQFSWWNAYGPTPRRCVALDGLFLAIDCLKIGAVRFDPQFTFDFYDLDFCLAAGAAGLELGTVNVYAHHGSTGDVACKPGYLDAEVRLRDKWLPRIGMGVELQAPVTELVE